VGDAINIEAVDKRAALLRTHLRWPIAKKRFCTDIPNFWLASEFRRTLIADTGAYALVIAITGLNRTDKENGASIELLAAALSKSGLASETRVRALVAQLQDQGVIQVVRHEQDNRRRRIIPTDALRNFQQQWFRTVLEPACEVFDLAMSAEALSGHAELAERYLTGVMLRHLIDKFTIFDGYPEVEAFMNRRHGYLLMLQLAGETDLVTDVAREKVANQFGVSSAHIAIMLAEAEAKGWLTRHTPSSRISLQPEFAERLDIWVSREIAIVGLWVEAKLA
jgi:DNA-binding MarR family transcriptional regulator